MGVLAEPAPVAEIVDETPAATPTVGGDTPTPTPAPAAEPDDRSSSQLIADFNKNLETQIQAGDEPVVGDDDDAEPAPAEEPTVEEPEKEGGEAETTPEEAAVEQIVTFAETDTPEEFAEKKKAVLEAVDLSTAPEIKALIEHQDARIEALSTQAGVVEGIANAETVVKFGQAVNSLYETETGENGEPIAKTDQFVNFLRTEMKNEYRPIAEAMFASDSMKYEGLNVWEEMLIDMVGQDKAIKISNFAKTDVPLPVVPDSFQLPSVVDDKNREAYFRLSEPKRFAINSLLTDISEMEAEFKDAADWRKEEIGPKLHDARESLKDELFAIESNQRNLDTDRAQKAAAERYQQERAVEFRSSVNTAYNAELFGIIDTFANELAPKLTYADTDTQLSQARNVMARVQNALGFVIEDDGRFTDDPLANHYAKQLSDEGIKFDFAKGRELLQRHYRAVEKLESLQKRKASPQAIEVAQKEKNRVTFDLKTEQKALMGQLSTKYVSSNAAAMTKQVDAIKAKKQIGRVTPNGKAVTEKRTAPVKDQIAEYNKKVAASNPEELYEEYAS